MAKRDYYEVLEVSRDAQHEDIKKAYRRLAIKYHPDRNPGDKESEEQFKEATEAYEVLADAQKRQAYDQFGFSGLAGMGTGGAHDFSSVFRDFEDIFGDFSGVFDSFFGGSRRRSHRSNAQRGADLRYDLEIDFKDAVFGDKKNVSYVRNDSCSACSGTGSDGGTGKKICDTCGGSGQVRRSSGFFSIATTCPTCSGDGQIIENPCRECQGAGLVRRNRKIKVTIPPGIEHGKRINIPGQGDAGISGGPAGNLYVYVHIREHEYFERDGNDAYCVVPISITQASLGCEVFVPTLDNKKIKLKIPQGTQNGKILRLRNEGIPFIQSPGRRGDMYIRISVLIPIKLSAKAKSLLKALSEMTGEDDSPQPLRISDL